MDTKTFNLIDSINREGIENGIWGMYDLGTDGKNSKSWFGTEEDVTIKGKVLFLYVNDDDSFCFVKPETADYKLTTADDTKLHIWKL